MPRKHSARAKSAAREPDRVLSAVLSQPWCITPEGLQLVLAVVSRGQITPEALEAAAGRELDNTHHVTVRDGVALIPVSGTLTARASMFGDISGATSYTTIVRDVQSAIAAADVKAIVLRFDSPGGQVHGCAEAAQLLFELRGTKPLIAYVEGSACSAAYWLAAACDEIVVASTAMLGCLGCQMAYMDDSKRLADAGLNEVIITSSQTPEKNRSPTDDDGLRAYQQIVDDLAGEFLNHVATLRGVPRDTVDAHYGRGAVLVGARAVSAGLGDRIGSYETLHGELLAGGTPGALPAVPLAHSHTQTGKGTMAKTAKRPIASRTRTTVTAAAFETGAEVSSLVTRDVGIAEGDIGTVVDIRDGSFYRVQTGDDESVSYAWLSEDEIAAVPEPVDDSEPGTDGGTDNGGGDNVGARDAKPSAFQAALTAAATAERKRITGILALANKVQMSALLAMVADANCSEQEAAHRVLTGKVTGARTSALGKLAGDEAALQGNGGLASTADGAPTQTTAQRILATTEAFNPRAVARKPRG
jgi:ClpP class serine protease